MAEKHAKYRRKRPDSATLARPKKIHVIHGGQSTVLLRKPLDGRTVLGRMYKEHVAALEEHLGNDLTPPQARLVDQASRLALLSTIAWSELVDNGIFKEGVPVPAVETFIKATSHEREILKLLGLTAPIKQVPALSDYIEGKNK